MEGETIRIRSYLLDAALEGKEMYFMIPLPPPPPLSPLFTHSLTLAVIVKFLQGELWCCSRTLSVVLWKQQEWESVVYMRTLRWNEIARIIDILCIAASLLHWLPLIFFFRLCVSWPPFQSCRQDTWRPHRSKSVNIGSVWFSAKSSHDNKKEDDYQHKR